MADQQAVEGSSTRNDSGGSSESTVFLNIKTLDSQTYTFNVDKNLQVSALKDKLATQIGVPVEQQRLIFRGKVLKDNHLLSEYHVENGDTLHLVLRQSQAQAPSGSSTGEATTNNFNRGQEPQPTAGGSWNRIGQVSQSVVLGTFNVGEQGEGLMPDLNRVIGAVLNTVGIGNMTGGQLPGVQASAPVPRPQANESPSQSSQQSGQAFSGQSLPQVLPIPLAAHVVNLPLLLVDSLITLSEFMDRMELVFSQNGNPPSQSPNNAGDPPAAQLPTRDRALSSPEALSLAVRQAERLFGGQVTAALSRFAGRLEREGASSDPALRGQVQAESVLIGQAMQHLGALLLELGRTILTFRMGQSPAESSLNAGPAVYISPTGPNPIMVQPFPFQTSSLFSNSAAVPPNPGTGTFGTPGISNAPRHVNIHIHAVGARATNGGGGAHGERVSGTDSGQSRVLPVGNIVATAVPPQPAVISVSSMPQPGQSDGSSGQERSTVSGAENDTVSTQLNEISASGMPEPEPEPVPVRAHNVTGGEDKMSQGQSSKMSHTKAEASASAGGAQRSGQDLGSPDESSSVPLGLGLGGLQPKRRTKQSVAHGISADGSTSNNPNELPKGDEHQFLQSLASLAVRRNETAMPSGTHSDRGVGTGNRSGNGQSDIADAMSSVIQSPALNGLLSGVSQQTGAGSPDLLRNMMQQLTQSPAMMNTVSQIAQQIDTQDLGSMFSGQGGGMNLSRMFQQMMPIVSQALGGISAVPQQIPNFAQRPGEDAAVIWATPTTENVQIDLHEVAQEIENNSPPVEILRSLVQSTESLQHNGSTDQSLADELSSEEDLANELMQMLRNDVSKRFQDKQGQ